MATIGTAASVPAAGSVKRGMWSSMRVTQTVTTLDATCAGVYTDAQVLCATLPGNIGKFLCYVKWSFYAAPISTGRFFAGVCANTTLTASNSGLGVRIGYALNIGSLIFNFVVWDGTTLTSVSTGVTANVTTIYEVLTSISADGTVNASLTGTTNGLDWVALANNTATPSLSFTALRAAVLAANGSTVTAWDVQFFSLFVTRR